MSLYKNFKADIDDSTGEISGYFSTYDRVADSYGDVIAPGAFTETLKAREESGHPFPLCWNHSLDVDDIIGVVDSIEDDEKGPHMTAHFFDTERAQKARELVKSGAIYQFSFAYQTQDEGSVKLEDGTKANELRKLDLFEVSIVPIPANQNAVVTEIKSGRRNSAKDADKLNQIIRLAQEVLGEIDDTEDNGNANEEPKANPEGEEQTEAIRARKDALLETIKSLENEEVTK
jgi:HK97 family phage prohead protease